ncbi:CDP-alcohol phosphatidyltransferase family protein [Geodermatophilus sp. SYSU D00703]
MTPGRLRTEQQLARAAVSQVVLLAALSATAGLGPAGWLTGGAYTAALWVLLSAAARRAGARTLGPADLVTLARAVLTGGVTALVAEGLWDGGVPTAALVLVASVALTLDAVDGRVARRSGTVSALGARFDMEVDSVLVLVLSVSIAGLLGPWVLAIGAMRYAFVAASWAVPWLRAPLPARRSAKAVAALQGIVLALAAADVLPRPVAATLVGGALALLVWSFGRSVVWLRRAARRPPGDEEAGHGEPRHADPGHADRAPVGWRRALAVVATALAGGLVLVALVAPPELAALTPAAFVRIPVEGLVGAAVLLVVPGRSRHVVAVLGGLALGVLTVLKVLDAGFATVLGRPFDPVVDWTTIGLAVAYVDGSSGRGAATGAVVAAVVAAAAVLGLLTASVLRLSRLLRRRRSAATRTLAALGTAWVVCALFGAQLVPNVPVAAASAAAMVHDRVAQVRAELEERRAFAAQMGVDAFADVPGDRLLTALRGKDVVLAVVESYGREAVEDPGLGTVLDDDTRRLAAAGFSARSGFLASPTTGAYSWLAHSTLLSGLWVDDQERYRTLVAGDRLTLTGAFGRAGWRTVGVMPGTTEAWPEAAFYGYDRVYTAGDLGYRGPDHGWPTIPDQFALAAFDRLEGAAPDRPPLMAEVVLTTSHAPWQFIPRIVGWDQVGDGSVFADMPAEGEPDALWTADRALQRELYHRSVAYTLGCLVSYVTEHGDDDLVLVVVGDHQPPLVAPADAGADVPIAVVSRDRAVLDRFAGWGWQEGLRPGPDAPVARMDTFRDRFLSTFGPG